ncbi:MAG: amidohydrolase family protein [Lentisphaeria bacterium]|nr:amidohydrolase family protein [Lentisphaeria bacterium]
MRVLLKGFICDGISEPSRSTMLIENGRIIAVKADIYGASAADKCYSFKDEIICPGFIDTHGHSDLALAAVPEAFSKRSQGFTSEISGNCGLSPFPLSEKNIDHIRELYASYGIDISWRTLLEYRNFLAAKNVKLRLFPLCGHNTLRAAVAGYRQNTLSASELNSMKQLLNRTLDDGALGMSSGLLYVPGCFTAPDEITELMRVLEKHQKVYALHLRSEGDQLLESLDETLNCARKAGLKKVLISHFKTARKENWHKLDDALKLIEDSRRNGIDVRVDRYPYVESQTMLSVILPEPFLHMGDVEITKRLADAETRKILTEQLHQKLSQEDWARLRLTGAKSPVHRNFIGKHFSEIPADPAVLTVEILASDATSATISAAGMSEKNMRRILMLDYCMAGSDGYTLSPEKMFGNTHPRSFGSGAKFMRLQLDYGISIGTAVAKLTSKPADFFQISSIGRLTTGYHADVTVFDPESIDCHADFTRPATPATGIKMSILAGNILCF